MSVTFWVPGAPRTKKLLPCSYGKGEPWACAPGARCGYCADGTEEVWESPAPELNVANETARVLLDVVGLPSGTEGIYGTLEAPQIASVRRRIVRALSTHLPERKALPGGAWGGPGTGFARVIDCGIDAERIRDRLVRLDAVLAYAQANGERVGWG